MFARTGLLDNAAVKSDQEINDFERSIRAVIESRNYERRFAGWRGGILYRPSGQESKQAGSVSFGIESGWYDFYHSSKSAARPR